jgi:hypothetical protein
MHLIPSNPEPIAASEFQRLGTLCHTRSMACPLICWPDVPETTDGPIERRQWVGSGTVKLNDEHPIVELGYRVMREVPSSHRQEKTFNVPLFDLDGISAEPWRLDRYRRAHEKFAAGETPPPILLYSSGLNLWTLADGNHRLFAARELGLESLPVLVYWLPSYELKSQYDQFEQNLAALTRLDAIGLQCLTRRCAHRQATSAL